MVGINNRNLGTFFTDVENSFAWPDNFLKIRYWYLKNSMSDPGNSCNITGSRIASAGSAKHL